MRKPTFLLTLLVLSLTTLNAQLFDNTYKVLDKSNFIVHYQELAKRDTLNPDEIRISNMLLFIGDSISLYLSKSLYQTDTLIRNMKTWEQFQESALDPNKPIPAYQYRIYKNYPEEKITITEHMISNTYLYEEDINFLEWQLLNDTLTVNGYKCQSATCNYGGRFWKAWFCADIPINDGPYKFCGLPGLIIQISDSTSDYIFNVTLIEKYLKPLNIDIDEKVYLKTSRKDFFKAQDSFRENIISLAKEAGANNVSMEIAGRNMAKRNNPIEIDRK